MNKSSKSYFFFSVILSDDGNEEDAYEVYMMIVISVILDFYLVIFSYCACEGIQERSAGVIVFDSRHDFYRTLSYLRIIFL